MDRTSAASKKPPRTRTPSTPASEKGRLVLQIPSTLPEPQAPTENGTGPTRAWTPATAGPTTPRIDLRHLKSKGARPRLASPRPADPASPRTPRTARHDRQLSKVGATTRLPRWPLRSNASENLRARLGMPDLGIDRLGKLTALPGARPGAEKELQDKVNFAIGAYNTRAREAQALLNPAPDQAAPSLGQLIQANRHTQEALKVLLENSSAFRSVVLPSDWLKVRAVRQEAKRALRDLKTQGDFLALKVDILPNEIAAHCQARVPINSATRDMPYHDGLLQEQAVPPIESGRLHAVEVLVYRVPDGAGGQQDKRVVFKAEPDPRTQGGPDVAGPMGIDRKHPNYAGRAVATHKIDQALGLGLVPPTHFAMHRGRIGVVMDHVEHEAAQSKQPGRVALPADVAAILRERPDALRDCARRKGYTRVDMEGDTVVLTAMRREQDPVHDHLSVEVPAEMLRPMDFNDPMVRRDLCDLNLLANLTGQCDLHLGNYGIRSTGQGHPRKLVAFDNDVSFGQATTSKGLYWVDHTTDEALAQNTAGRDVAASKATGLPPVVARDTFNSVMAMTPKRLEKLLDGLVTPAEIKAAQARLMDIQAHLRELPDDAVLDDGDWHDPGVAERLGLAAIAAARHDPTTLKAMGPDMQRRHMVARDAWLLACAEASDPALSDDRFFDAVVVENELIDLAHDLHD